MQINKSVFKHPSEFNNLSEIQCEKWFHLLGIKIKKLSPPGPDYEIPDEHIGVECSIMDVYKNADVLADLRKNLCNKKGTEQYVKITVDENSNVVAKNIKKFKRNDEIAVLIVEYDLSAVRKKHLSKLNKEIEHFQGFEKCLLVLDYRYFMFCSSILSTEWNDILQQYGESYKSLLGVILVTLKTAKDDVTVDSPVLQFIQNPHTPFQIPKQLESITLIDEQYHVKPVSIEVCGTAGGVKFEVTRKYLKKFGLDAEIIRANTIETKSGGQIRIENV